MATEEGEGAAGLGRRKPSWRERENNRRRERRRRAIAAKIFTGLRAQGNYNLPKHSDNNEVLKALCAEAGWIVLPDGTTYRKGCKPPRYTIDRLGNSNNISISGCSSQIPSPLSSAFHSPIPSYQPSPSTSALQSPTRNDMNAASRPLSLLCTSISSSLPPLRISNSAPVTPLLSSPTSKEPKQSFNFESIAEQSIAAFDYPMFAESAPSSPTRCRNISPPTIFECDESDYSIIDSGRWFHFQKSARPPIPTSSNLCMVKPMAQKMSLNDPMDVGVSELGNVQVTPWEGEKIHDAGMDDLELTLGSGRVRT